jgi:hypothetical protein
MGVVNKTLILASSLAVNAVFGVVWVSHQMETPKPTPVQEAPKPIIKTKVQRVMVEVPGETQVTTNWSRIDWRAIESEDYVKYIANLRAAGCPEETIRDLIIADVNKMYAAKWRSQHASEHEWKYWENESKKDKKEERKTDERRELEKERDELVRSLLGVDLKSELAKYSWDGDRNNRDARYAFLPEDKQIQVKDLNERYKEDMRKLVEDGKAANLTKEELAAKAAILRKQHEQDLAGTLSPGELVEYQLRNSPLAGRLRNELTSFEPSEEEFRKLYQTLKPLGDQAVNSGEKFSLENNPDVVDMMKKALSPERFAEWQETQQPAYRDAVKIAQRFNLSAEDTKLVAQINQTTETEMAKAMVNPNLTPEQRVAAAKAIKEEKKKVLNETLGKRVKRKQ